MVIAPYYRDFDLPWEGDPESSARFRKILRVLLIILVVLGIAFPLLPTPQREAPEEVPQRLARVMLENQPKPPPPPPPVPKEEKPKIEPKIALVKPPPARARRSSWSSTATRDASTACTRGRCAIMRSCRASWCSSSPSPQ